MFIVHFRRTKIKNPGIAQHRLRIGRRKIRLGDKDRKTGLRGLFAFISSANVLMHIYKTV